jgi:hypothetical protein
MIIQIIISSFLLFASLTAWVGKPPSERFDPLLQASLNIDLVSYLSDRGVSEEDANYFFEMDKKHLAHALSLVFEQDSNLILAEQMGVHIALLDDLEIKIDHVGREIYGPLSFYIPLLKEIAPQLGLINTRNIVFPSTQVVKVLQVFDPTLKGVTVGRLYFQSLDNGDTRCIELFQASTKDDKNPQSIGCTTERFSLLISSKSDSKQSPIEHLSVEVQTSEEVYRIHKRIHALACDTLFPYQQAVSYNPGDGSTNTKALMRATPDAPFNRIVEFVHYKE